MSDRVIYGLSIHFKSGAHVELMASDPDTRAAALPTLTARENDDVVELVEFTMHVPADDPADHADDTGDACDCPACRRSRAGTIYH